MPEEIICRVDFACDFIYVIILPEDVALIPKYGVKSMSQNVFYADDMCFYYPDSL